MTWPVQLSVWEKGDQSDQCATPRQSHQAMGEHIRSLLILVILVNMEILAIYQTLPLVPKSSIFSLDD